MPRKKGTRRQKRRRNPTILSTRIRDEKAFAEADKRTESKARTVKSELCDRLRLQSERRDRLCLTSFRITFVILYLLFIAVLFLWTKLTRM